MSGDGVEDVSIPSVFMKEEDAQSLLDVARQSPEAVVVKLSAVTKKEGEVRTEEEGGKGRGEGVEMKEGVLRMDTTSAQTVEEVSQHLQKLLDGLDPDILTDKLKDSVAEELQKLRTLNSGQSFAGSTVELLNSKENTGDETNSVNFELGSAEIDQNCELRTMNSELCSADSADMAGERTLHTSAELEEISQGSESDGG